MAEEKDSNQPTASSHSSKDEGASEKIEVPKKFEDIVKKIEEMSVLDLAELVKILEKRFGVSSMPIIGAGTAVAPVGAPSAAPAAEEKTFFTVVLTGVGDKKIDVIKVVRDTTEKGLKEAKDLVDAAATSAQVVKENVKKEEAEEMKKKFEAVGAKVELK